MFIGSLIKRIYIALSLILLLPFLGFGIYSAHREKEYNLLVKADEMSRIANVDWILLSLMIWFVLMLIIAYFFQRVNLSIAHLACQISQKDDDQKSLADLPQFIPVLDAIRNKYWGEVQRLKQLKDACPVAAVVVDKHGMITAHNDMYATIIERHVGKCQKLIGMSLRQLMNSVGIPEEELIFPRVLQGESNVESHQKLVGAEWITRGRPLIDEDTGEILGAVISVTDITERENFRREMGRQERLNVVGEMAASVAHEIRNPMTVVRGNLQLMALKSDDKNRYSLMIDELDRANDIIEDFLSLARNRPVPKSLCDINQIVSRLQPLLYSETVERGGVLELDLEANLPDLLLSEKEIKQLILHLFRNANDAIEDDGWLILRTQRVGSFIELQVQDNGCGISEDCLNKLTEPFYTTKSNGTGLGLAICRSIVEQHNAALSIDSLEGVGTTVTIRFHSSNRISLVNLAECPSKAC
ncbi:MAG: atoS 1 [Anaerosporomusa subterranea]|nr:atoS 1 [Anaerosporomusa subterranea]